MVARRTILISGAANGLGAAFLEVYRSQPESDIIALDQHTIHSTSSNVTSYSVDISSEASIRHIVANQLSGQPIDLVIHSAGVRGLVRAVEDENPNDVAACETLEVMDRTTLLRTFEINAAGTFLLLRALLPNLKLAKEPKVVVMSSRMGSIGYNQLPNRAAGAAYAYRASKAALNMLVRSFAVDVPEVTFVLCHPGRVETKLVKCREEGAISPEQSVRGILPLIERWSHQDSGRYFDRFGETIEW